MEHLGQFSISTSSLCGSVFGQRLQNGIIEPPAASDDRQQLVLELLRRARLVFVLAKDLLSDSAIGTAAPVAGMNDRLQTRCNSFCFPNRSLKRSKSC